MKTNAIYNYEHPFVTVDGVIIRFREKLEVLLVKRTQEPLINVYSLPGGFVDIDKTLDETLYTKIQEKTGVSGYYVEQLKTYGEIKRDSRGRVISVAYIGLMRDVTTVGDWFEINGEDLVSCNTREVIRISDLPFDHSTILRDALIRIKNKLWYSDIMRYLLPEKFLARDMQNLVDIIEGKRVNNLRRRTADRVTELGIMTSPTKEGGRPAQWLQWNDNWEG